MLDIVVLMSNMSPQLPGFNRGIWKRLEELVRAIALKEKEIYVVTGAIFPPAAEAKYLQSGKITVPNAYYKVVYDLTPPDGKLYSFKTLCKCFKSNAAL